MHSATGNEQDSDSTNDGATAPPPAPRARATAAAAAPATVAPAPKVLAPLFESDVGGLAYILVRRLEPVMDAGTLGQIDPDATEMHIKERWGGGKYHLEGKDHSNRVVKGCKTSIQIAGDPVFSSPIKRQQFMQQQGLEPVAAPALPVVVNAPAAAAAATPAAPSFGEMMTLMMTLQQQAQQQAQQAFAQQLQIIQQADAARERDRQAREDARAQEAERSRDRDREHQKALLELIRSAPAGGAGGGGQLEAFTAGIKTALQLAGGRGGGDDDADDNDTGDDDPVVTAIKTVGTVITDAMGGRKAGADKQNQAGEQSAEGGAPQSGSHAADGSGVEPITLVGPIAKQAREFVAAQKALGKDPEVTLSRALIHLTAAAKKTREAQKPEPAPAETNGASSAPWPPPAHAGLPVAGGEPNA